LTELRLAHLQHVLQDDVAFTRGGSTHQESDAKIRRPELAISKRNLSQFRKSEFVDRDIVIHYDCDIRNRRRHIPAERRGTKESGDQQQAYHLLHRISS
jgi:hypothetical protein